MRNFRTNYIITGIILVVLGGLAMRYPVDALMTVGFFIGLGLLASGINYFSAFYFFGLKRFILLGLLDFVMGVYMIVQPGITALIIPFVIGLWFICTGFSRIGMSLWFGGAGGKGWWLMLINGIALIALGGLVFASPLNVSLSVILTMILGGSFIASGVLTVLEGFLML
ncbi:MAG: DUF308 domain-containing protein [Synergistaceae bacterium]|nr:DUF308 domain-containing protein [Synergistaceae bacterium]